jgi:hypothetical protein
MRPDPETITLGGKSWTIEALTLRQLREIAPISGEAAAGKIDQLEYMEKLITAVLRRKYPDDIADLPDLEMTIPELKEAQAAIMRLSGLAKAKEPAEGETVAAPQTATTGEPSTGA